MKRYFSRFSNQLHYKKEKDMSSGKYKSKHPFNPMQIKDGKVVRLNKNGTIKSILGTLADMKKGKNKNDR